MWSDYDVWDILKIAQKSFSEQFKELRKYCIKIGSTTIKIKELQSFLGEQESEEGHVNNQSQIKNESKSGIKSEKRGSVIDEKLLIEQFLNQFEAQGYPYAILKSKFQLSLWKNDGKYFLFDLRDADETGNTKIEFSKSKKNCPYVAWFDSINPLLDHIMFNLPETGDENYEFCCFKLKAKIEKNLDHKSWYNFSPVNDSSNQWMIRSLYGSLQNHYGLAGCVITLVFASVLQPSDWNSSMLDSAMKYGTKLYKKSLKTNLTEGYLKLNSIVSPFIIGCYEFSFMTGLFKCGANEQNFLENGISNLFNHADYGIISSKGYSVAIWQQNNSYFIFDPNVNGMACLSRFSNTTLISKHFLSHVSTGMTGVNIFEIYKVRK